MAQLKPASDSLKCHCEGETPVRKAKLSEVRNIFGAGGPGGIFGRAEVRCFTNVRSDAAEGIGRYLVATMMYEGAGE
jgi:hypothetical protein